MRLKMLLCVSFCFFVLGGSVFAERFAVDDVSFCTDFYEGDYADISKKIPAGEAIVCELPSKVQSLTIPSKVEHGGKSYAVKEIYYASGVSIYKYGRELESVVLEEGIERIGFNAFFQCEHLKTISIPSTCTYIDLDTGLPNTDSSGNHWYCDLERVIVAKKNPVYSSKNGILYDKKSGKVLFVPHNNKAKK